MKKIGLSGVMGAGKSSVSTILKEMGILVLDCDQINAELLKPYAAGYQQVVKKFHPILNEKQEIDHALLSKEVFADESKRKELEAIMHPLIKQQIEYIFESSDVDLIVVEVPLLFEIGWESFFDEIWCVICEEELLLKRLKEGRNISKEEALRRLKYQMSQDEKMIRSNVILTNNGTKEALKKQIIQALGRK